MYILRILLGMKGILFGISIDLLHPSSHTSLLLCLLLFILLLLLILRLCLSFAFCLSFALHPSHFVLLHPSSSYALRPPLPFVLLCPILFILHLLLILRPPTVTTLFSLSIQFDFFNREETFMQEVFELCWHPPKKVAPGNRELCELFPMETLPTQVISEILVHLGFTLFITNPNLYLKYNL
jgi:hypothetical protein